MIKYVDKVDTLFDLQRMIGIKKTKKTLSIIHITFACYHSTRVMGYKKINKKCPYLPC